MNRLEKKKKEILERYRSFGVLQKYRHIDFPDNSLFLCENNLSFFIDYFQNTVCKSGYSVSLDTVLVTHIVNFLSSVKSYLNRKKRSVAEIPGGKYKSAIDGIIERYWSPKRKSETNIDKAIRIRDKFEHEAIRGISLKITYFESGWKKEILYDGTSLNSLFVSVIVALKKMNFEIENYIESTLRSCDLRDCALFMNAFNRRFSKEPFTDLYPKPTEEEIVFYDKTIDDLLKQK